MKLRLYLLVCMLLAVPAEGPFLFAQQTSKTPYTKKRGTVTGITGQWKIIGAEELHFLKPVNEDSCAEGTDGVLVVVFDDKAYSYACDRPSNVPSDDECEKNKERLEQGFRCFRHISPAKVGFIQQTNQSLSAAVNPLFQESPARYITPVSRGLESQTADGVALLQGNRVDVAPVLQEMDLGTYRLRVEPLSGSAGSPASVQLQWTGSGPAFVPIPGVKPGLYRIVRLTPNGEPEAGDAWILISGPDRFAKDSASFHSAVEATKKWPDDVDARAPRAVLRAYLDSLSRQEFKGR